MSISTAQVLRIDRAIFGLQWARELASSDENVSLARPEQPCADEWLALSAREVRPELDALLLGRRPDLGLDALLELGFLDVWLPEISAMVGFGDAEFRHKDVWKHTKQVVWQSVPRLNVRWGSLLHDIGKLKTRSVADNGEVHFFGHSEVGASMFKKRLGSFLRARTYWSQMREIMLRLFSFNVLILVPA